MHLVKTEDESQTPAPLVGGLAGWIIAWLRGLWLGAKMRGNEKKQMRVIEILSIGGRKQLVLVSCAGEQFVVGTGADSVQTIVRVHSVAESNEHPRVQGFGERL